MALLAVRCALVSLLAFRAQATSYGSGSSHSYGGNDLSTGAGAPLPGHELAKHADGQDPLNEPCYTHGGACVGYPVCCVTFGTCASQHQGVLSSNQDYYEGGCQSKLSSNPNWTDAADGCTEVGECHWVYLQHQQNATTAAGMMTDVPMAVTARLVAGSEPNGGTLLDKHADGQHPLNEPCYTHAAGVCVDYPVCCVTYGTCVSQHQGTLSSNRLYYEGGCQSPQSSDADWDGSAEGCQEVGECHWIYLQEHLNATTAAGLMTETPADVVMRLMQTVETTTTTTIPRAESELDGAGTEHTSFAARVACWSAMLLSLFFFFAS